jgi:hypothetical protein
LGLYKEAKAKLSCKYLVAAVEILIADIIIGTPVSKDIKFRSLSILLVAPLSLGFSSFILNIIREKKLNLN